MIFQKKYLFLFKYLFVLFPFLLISGPFLPDLFVVSLVIYFIIYCFLNKKIFFLKNNLIIFFLLFYFYINLNSFFSFNPLISFATSLPYLRMILFSIFVAYFIMKIVNLKKIIFFSFLFSYLILFIDSIIQLKTGFNFLGYPIIEGRISSFFGNKLVMGSYVSRTLPIIIAISYLETFKQVNFLRVITICLAACLVFFSAERVSLFYFIMTVLIYAALLPNRNQFFLQISIFVILFSLLSFFKPSTVDRVFKHTLFQFAEKKGSWFSERHEMHFITAYRMFLDKKFLGHGIKSFRYLCDQEPYSTEDLIKRNNQNYAPINGYYYLKKNFLNNKSFVYYVLESEKSEFEKISNTLEDAQILKNSSKISEAEINFYLFKNNKKLITLEIKDRILDSIQSSSKVSKGDYVFSNNEYENGCNTHPHSFHLQILSELGLIGYGFLFFFLIYLIFLFLKYFINIIFKKKPSELSNNLYIIFIVLALIQHLFPLVPSGNIFNNWLSIFFYFKLAFLLNFNYYNKK